MTEVHCGQPPAKTKSGDQNASTITHPDKEHVNPLPRAFITSLLICSVNTDLRRGYAGRPGGSRAAGRQ